MIWPVSRDWKPSEAPPDILILEEQAVKLAEGGAVYHDPTHVSRVAAITPTDSPNFSRKKAAGNTNRTYTTCKSMSTENKESEEHNHVTASQTVGQVRADMIESLDIWTIRVKGGTSTELSCILITCSDWRKRDDLNWTKAASRRERSFWVQTCVGYACGREGKQHKPSQHYEPLHSSPATTPARGPDIPRQFSL